jgi:hypothetical protein
VPQPLFTVSIADLERGPKEITWPLGEAWLRHAFAGTEVTASSPSS